MPGIPANAGVRTSLLLLLGMDMIDDDDEMEISKTRRTVQSYQQSELPLLVRPHTRAPLFPPRWGYMFLFD